MKRPALILLVCSLVLLSAYAVRKACRAYQRQTAITRLESSDPIQATAALTMPVLLVHGANDTLVPAADHSACLAPLLPSSEFVSVPGEHGTPAALDAERVCRFLSARHIQAPVILLHAWGQTANDWDCLTRSPASPTDRARVQFASALRRHYEVITDNFAGNAWGNDAALSRLESVIGSRRQVVLIGESMGGLLMLRYAEKHPEKVSALVGIYPVCSTSAIFHRPRSEFGRVLSEDMLKAY